MRTRLTSLSLPRFLKLRRRPLFSFVGVEGILARFWGGLEKLQVNGGENLVRLDRFELCFGIMPSSNVIGRFEYCT